MEQAIEKLYKIFKLEAEFGYTNKAVVGGIDRLIETWINGARSEGVDEERIHKVTEIMEKYPDLNAAKRAHAVREIGSILGNAGMKNLPFPEIIPEEQMTSPIPTESPEDIETNQRESRGTIRKKAGGPAPIPNSIAPEGLDAPTTAVRGIGSKQSQLLAKLNLYTIEDMLYYFPHRYDDYSELKLIKDLKYGEEVTILGWVENISTFTTRNKNRKIIRAVISDNTGTLQLMWFNQEYHMRYLRKNMFLSFSGKVEQYMGRLVMYHPDYEQIEEEQLNTKRIVPVYSLTAQLSQKWLRRSMYNVVTHWAPRIPEFLTEYILDDAELMDLSTALREIHFPDSMASMRKARYRLAFDEVFLLQLGMLRQKYEWSQFEGRCFEVDDDWLFEQINQLPYKLTNAQIHVLAQLRHDLASGHPMNRLLQGDVGSGKTVVAAMGLGIVLKNNAQGALMTPTSILAEQHYVSLKNLLADPENKNALLREDEIRLLIGDTSQTDRDEILSGLAEGTIKLVIGTHALIEDPVTFKDLQMVVVDEQHRFGVAQRAALREKGENVHILVMTATPIPRSLALTIYGDLDVSVIDEMPPGRQPIETHIVYPTERERVYTFVHAQVDEGHQAFIIYPLVEQGENEQTKAAVEEQLRLQNEIFPDLNVGLMHGRLRPDEKEAVMRKFRDQQYDILVATSVVEVGLDIPNATIMVIEGANRFGLAQLHQFRGRVGRGAAKSFCILIPETNEAAENERLQAMESTNDGFILAEYDLSQRGPGEFLGTRQSGYTELRLANITNTQLIERAQRYAHQVLKNDPGLSAPEHKLMLDALEHFWPSRQGGMN